jgi:hypothetical protein
MTSMTATTSMIATTSTITVISTITVTSMITTFFLMIDSSLVDTFSFACAFNVLILPGLLVINQPMAFHMEGLHCEVLLSKLDELLAGGCLGLCQILLKTQNPLLLLPHVRKNSFNSFSKTTQLLDHEGLDLVFDRQAERGCARSRLLLKICVVAKRMVRTTINLVGTLHVVRYVHHKRGGMLRTGYRLKEQEIIM